MVVLRCLFFYVPGTGQPREVTGEESGEGAGKSGDNMYYCIIILYYVITAI